MGTSYFQARLGWLEFVHPTQANRECPLMASAATSKIRKSGKGHSEGRFFEEEFFWNSFPSEVRIPLSLMLKMYDLAVKVLLGAGAGITS